VILVACPTCEAKAYALERWARAFDDFNFNDRAAFMVDNTPGTLRYTHRIRQCGIPAVHIEPLAEFWDTMEVSWRVILEYAHELRAEWIASIEADVICPSDTLLTLLGAIGSYDTVFHRYPTRGQPQNPTCSIGCALVTTSTLYRSRNLWVENMESVMFNGLTFEVEPVLTIEHRVGCWASLSNFVWNSSMGRR
jgi:hypothetical protein